MANVYSQLYLQFVFAVQERRSLIPREKKEELHKFITGVLKNRKSKMLAINCMPDHAHIFTGFNPNISISKFVGEIKVASNDFINEKRWLRGSFNWQEGYGVFSYSHSHIDKVVKYIMNQEDHHRRVTFKNEYYGLLKKFDIPFDEKYVFDFIDGVYK